MLAGFFHGIQDLIYSLFIAICIDLIPSSRIAQGIGQAYKKSARNCQGNGIYPLIVKFRSAPQTVSCHGSRIRECGARACRNLARRSRVGARWPSCGATPGRSRCRRSSTRSLSCIALGNSLPRVRARTERPTLPRAQSGRREHLQ